MKKTGEDCGQCQERGHTTAGLGGRWWWWGQTSGNFWKEAQEMCSQN